ncbi:UbiA family prenyltransferase [Candidatus Viridilinea mediisalina]|uniref:Prenyltransferase n=1 Tax=Candidatus Viridilinea mediisalina TaxID=2024553 RepID=A0A2A6RKW3_9CHLR|nr:UbiA family prenyltransferase [Candidatus Viridilinea mediisalina]PDW03682.1 hypothetical protein CJ255_07620 [Candidatus Viridilinea mediisalina]
MAWYLITFLRPHVALQAVLYALLGSMLSSMDGPQDGSVTWLALLALMAIVSFGFVINDYVDLELDRRNKPTRFLPAKLVSPGAARSVGMVLVATVLSLALWLPLALQVLVGFNLMLTAAYSLWLKRTVLLGNLSIAYLNSSILFYGALLAAGPTLLVWLVALSSMLYSLAQEVLYTVEDYAGDRDAGIVTTAIYLGLPHALSLVQGLLLLALLSTLLPLGLQLVSFWYALLLLVCVLLPLGLWIMPNLRSADAARITRACRAVKWVRVSSLVPFVSLVWL